MQRDVSTAETAATNKQQHCHESVLGLDDDVVVVVVIVIVVVLAVWIVVVVYFVGVAVVSAAVVVVADLDFVVDFVVAVVAASARNLTTKQLQ